MNIGRSVCETREEYLNEKWKVVSTAVTFGKINKEPVKRLEEFGCEVVLNPFGRPFTNEEIIRYASDADALIVGNDKVPGMLSKM